ncbi:CvpA family protein [Eubacteriales bacterium OttesenSCG-928-K08]|nr:CvpA family protein [Eubacteriales bacterium OttesenSCG-928-K08]
MSIIDIVVLAVFAFFVLSGWYRGLVSTLLSIGAYIVSAGLALIMRPLLSNLVFSNASLYNMALYYAEGAEFVYDVELSKSAISQLGSSQLSVVMERAELPIPVGTRISENIAKEAFAADGLTTLGEYFNQTIVNVFINLLCVLVLFVAIRLIFAFIINMIDYARRGYPVLQSADGLIGAGFGLIRGFLAMYIIFLVTPAVLIVLPSIGDYLFDSFFGTFFYNTNFLLRLIPGI